VPGDSHVYPEMAAAGLWTTPSDLARFAIGVQSAQAADGPLLPRPLARAMLAPGQGRYGLGPVLTEDGLRFGREGATTGFQAQVVARVDGGPGVAIMTNSDAGLVLAHEIVLTLAREYGWSAPLPEVRRTIPVDAATLRALAGRYLDGDSGLEFRVMPREGVLRLVIDGSPEQELVPEAQDEYFVRQTGDRVRFQKQGDTMFAVLPGGNKAMRIEP